MRDRSLNRRLTSKEEIEILLKEYDVIHSEKLQIISSYQNFTTVWFSSFSVVAILIFQFNLSQMLPILPGLFISFAAQEYRRWQYLLWITTYISVVEEKINFLANENLLRWDSLGPEVKLSRLITRRGKKIIINPDPIALFMMYIFALPLFLIVSYQAVSYIYNHLILYISNDITIYLCILYGSIHSVLILIILYLRFFYLHRYISALKSTLQEEWRLQATK